IPLHGSYTSDILPGLLVTSLGTGGVFVGLATAANAGVREDDAGVAAGLLNTGQQLGTALGLAILSALATARTTSLLSDGHSTITQAATAGYQRGLLAGAGFVLAAGLVALLAAPNRRHAAAVIEKRPEPALDNAA
ncbi:MAG TPA: MFS transporter, partial [Candidatus Dormibacteraeota bacterium]|nr:MFS transporter [Candidatus Dormibacteraeota bacterium]